jgi:hypothetical protein
MTMTKRKANIALAAALLCAISAGCGSGGGTSGDAGVNHDTGSLPGVGTFTWKEGGTTHSAQFATASIITMANLELLEIAAGDPNVGIALAVSVQPPPITTGPYACGGSNYPIVSFSYTGASGQNQTCMINLTSVGTTTGSHVVGTFSASFALTAGGTKTITDGQFDVTAIVSAQ